MLSETETKIKSRRYNKKFWEELAHASFHTFHGHPSRDPRDAIC